MTNSTLSNKKLLIETKDFQDEMKIELKSRFTSPFTGSFIICWIITNIKLILFVLFSECTIEYKIKHSSEYTDSFSSWLYPLSWAIIYTLIIVFVIPRLKVQIKKINLEVFSALKNLDIIANNQSLINSLEHDINKLKDEKIISEENFQITISAYEKNISEYSTEIDNLNHAISNLNTINQNSELVIKDLKSRILRFSNLEKEFINVILSDKDLYIKFYDKKFEEYQVELKNNSDFNKIPSRLLNSMIKEGYISANIPNELTGKWEFQKLLYLNNMK